MLQIGDTSKVHHSVDLWCVRVGSADSTLVIDFVDEDFLGGADLVLQLLRGVLQIGDVLALIQSERAALESRILYCYEIDDSCSCDDSICKL